MARRGYYPPRRRTSTQAAMRASRAALNRPALTADAVDDSWPSDAAAGRRDDDRAGFDHLPTMAESRAQGVRYAVLRQVKRDDGTIGTMFYAGTLSRTRAEQLAFFCDTRAVVVDRSKYIYNNLKAIPKVGRE